MLLLDSVLSWHSPYKRKVILTTFYPTSELSWRAILTTCRWFSRRVIIITRSYFHDKYIRKCKYDIFAWGIIYCCSESMNEKVCVLCVALSRVPWKIELKLHDRNFKRFSINSNLKLLSRIQNDWNHLNVVLLFQKLQFCPICGKTTFLYI